MTNKLFISFLLVFGVMSVNAQFTYNSPYSRYGIGVLNTAENAYQFGQGGLRYTTSKPNIANTSNAASYSFIRRNTPIFDIAFNTSMIQFTSDNQTQNSVGSSIANFTLGLPVGKRSGLLFSYQPYSKMGYNVVDSLTTDDGHDYSNSYFGHGGINKFTAGLSHIVYVSDSNNLKVSTGINASYVYGSLFNVRNSSFSNTSGYNSFFINDSVSVKDLTFDAGLMVKYQPNPKWNYTLGVVYKLETALKAQNEFVAYTYNGTTSGVIDTVKFVEPQSGEIVIPQTIGLAFQGVYNGKFGYGVQYSLTDWGNFQYPFASYSNTTFEKSEEYNLGLWYKPSGLKGNVNGGALKNATFKMGARSKSLGINLNNTSIVENAISLGMHLPLVNSKSFSSVNFGTEFGQRGTTANNLVLETFVRFKIGLSITPTIDDRWFVKRKFD